MTPKAAEASLRKAKAETLDRAHFGCKSDLLDNVIAKARAAERVAVLAEAARHFGSHEWQAWGRDKIASELLALARRKG